MKTFVIVTALLLSLSNISAQAPNAFKYQAVARDDSGIPISNKDVSIRIKIFEGPEVINPVYTEVHNIRTNQFGLINLVIGKGLVVDEKDFSSISWGNDEHFLQVEISDNDDETYQVMGNSQLLSVPYALYAENGGNNTDTSATNELQQLSLLGNALTISNGNSVMLNNLNSPWEQDGDTITALTKHVTIGTNNSYRTGLFENTYLTIGKENPLTYGRWNGIRTSLDVSGTSFIGSIASNSTSAYTYDQTYSAYGVTGHCYDVSYVNRSSGGESQTVGGGFTMDLNNLEIGSQSSNYYVCGLLSVLRGTVNEYPENGVVSAIFGRDQINSTETYAGYFEGKGYFSGNVGIGIKNPQRPLHINGPMRFEPLVSYPSSPSNGDMFFNDVDSKLYVYDGSWTALNSGNDTSSWKINGDTITAKTKFVTIGTDNSHKIGEFESTYLTIGDDSPLTYGTRNGIVSSYNVSGSSFVGNIMSRIGHAGTYIIGGAAAAISGTCQDISYVSREGGTAYFSGGSFGINFSNLEIGNQSGQYGLCGVTSRLSGTINEYPLNGILAAVYGIDDINSLQTHAGYFEGKGYFSGNVGFGTTTPNAKVQVTGGDIYIEDIDKGVIMKSPNGSCWRLTVDDSGNIVTTAISCP